MKQNLDLIPDHDTETAFAERLLVPLEEGGVVKWLLAALHNKKKHKLEHFESGEGGGRQYRANEALPTPLATKRFDGPHPVSNALFAPLTFWHPQPHVTVLAIRVPLVDREPHVCIFEYSVSCEAPIARCRGGRGKERISAFGTEEMLFVVGSGA